MYVYIRTHASASICPCARTHLRRVLVNRCHIALKRHVRAHELKIADEIFETSTCRTYLRVLFAILPAIVRAHMFVRMGHTQGVQSEQGGRKRAGNQRASDGECARTHALSASRVHFSAPCGACTPRRPPSASSAPGGPGTPSCRRRTSDPGRRCGCSRCVVKVEAGSLQGGGGLAVELPARRCGCSRCSRSSGPSCEGQRRRPGVSAVPLTTHESRRAPTAQESRCEERGAPAQETGSGEGGTHIQGR